MSDAHEHGTPGRCTATAPDVRPPVEHREPFLVRSYEVEPDGRLRLVALLRMLQEAAWQHADLLGKGFHRREEGALFWVLSRLRLRVDRYPRWGDRFTIRTYPVGTERLFAIREFALLDDADRVIGRATSGWLVVDGGRGRPIRPQQLVADLTTTPSEFDGDLKRVPALPEAADPAADGVRSGGPFPVYYHDIDQYRHVNNAAYLEWILDSIDPSRTMTSEVAALEIDFLKETVLDDEWSMRILPDGATDAVEVLRGARLEPAARARLTWRPIGR